MKGAPKDSVQYSLDREKDMEKALAEGFQVLTPGQNQLFLDLDNFGPADVASFRARARHVGNTFGFEMKEWWVSKSGSGRHVIMEAPDAFPIAQRIALQAMMGSDWVKELFSLWRLENGIVEPILLFRPGKAEIRTPLMFDLGAGMTTDGIF